MVFYLFNWLVIIIGIFSRFLKLVVNAVPTLEHHVESVSEPSTKPKRKKFKSAKNSIPVVKLSDKNVANVRSKQEKKSQTVSVVDIDVTRELRNNVSKEDLCSHENDFNAEPFVKTEFSEQSFKEKTVQSSEDTESVYVVDGKFVVSEVIGTELLHTEEIKYFTEVIRRKKRKSKISSDVKTSSNNDTGSLLTKECSIFSTRSKAFELKSSSNVSVKQFGLSSTKGVDKKRTQFTQRNLSNDGLKSDRVDVKLPVVRIIDHSHRTFSRAEYKEKTKGFVESFSSFRNMHIKYVIDLISYVFFEKDGKILVNPKVSSFILSVTKHVDLCIFIIKVSLIKNLLCIFNISVPFNSFRYCARHFYDQGLIDSVLSGVLYGFKFYNNDINKSYQYLDSYLVYLYTLSDYEMYSGEFYMKLLDMCCDFIAITSQHKEKNLINFIRLSCVLCITYMCNVLVCLFNTDVEFQTEKEFLFGCKNVPNLLRNIRKGLEHMYHPSYKNNLYQIGEIYLPSAVIRICSNKICSKVIKHLNDNTMGFHVIVADLSSYIAFLLSRPSVRSKLEEVIAIYDKEVKTIDTSEYFALKNDLYNLTEPSMTL